MDFYDLFSSFTQFDILASMLLPFFESARINLMTAGKQDLFYGQGDQNSNPYNMYKYNIYYKNNAIPEALSAQGDISDVTNNSFYNLQSQQSVQNLYEAAKFVQYVQTYADKTQHSLIGNKNDSNELKSKFYANSAINTAFSDRTVFKGEDVDKIISSIELKLTHDLEASPCGVYS